MEDGLNETSETPSARAFGFGFALLKKRGEWRFNPPAARVRARERVSIDGSQNLSVAESNDSKCVVRCCLTSRSSVVEVDVCMYARRARFAAASKRVLRCNRVKTARKSEKAKTIAIADSDRPKIYGSGCRVSREIRRTCPHFCVTGNAYALCVHHLFQLGAPKTSGARKIPLVKSSSRHLGVSLSETRVNQIFAERTVPTRADARKRPYREARDVVGTRARIGHLEAKSARHRRAHDRLGDARGAETHGISERRRAPPRNWRLRETRRPHVSRASRPRFGSSAFVRNDALARFETPGVEREERDGVFRPLRPLEDRVRRASRIQLTGRGGAARERRAPVVRARGTAPPGSLRARVSRASHASPRDDPREAGVAPHRRPDRASDRPSRRI